MRVFGANWAGYLNGDVLGTAWMDVETLRKGYRSFGLGVPKAMPSMFDQDFEGGGAEWEVGVSRSRLVRRAGTAAYDLFGGEQQGWEIARVVPNGFVENDDAIVVTGHVFWRPKGSTEVVPVPFLHVWKLREHRLVQVMSYLEGIELKRVEDAA